jgi:hypothetical protein
MGAHKSNMVAQMAKAGTLKLVFPGADSDHNHDIASVEVVFVDSEGRGRLMELHEVEQMAIARTLIMARRAQAGINLGKPEMRYADVVVMPRELAESIVYAAEQAADTDKDMELIKEAKEFLGIKTGSEEVKS